MIIPSSHEIKNIEEIIEILPYRGNFQIEDIEKGVKGNFIGTNRIINFLIENDLIDASNYSKPMLTDNGRKLQELKSYEKYIKWSKQKSIRKRNAAFFTERWIWPLLLSVVLTAIATVTLEKVLNNEKTTNTTPPHPKQIETSTCPKNRETPRSPLPAPSTTDTSPARHSR